MSPEDGVSAWQSYIRPLADQGYTLGSPATTSAPDGFDWMTNFMQQCNDCAVTDIALHWYDVHFSDFQTYVEKWATAFKKPVRITEFACQVRHLLLFGLVDEGANRIYAHTELQWR